MTLEASIENPWETPSLEPDSESMGDQPPEQHTDQPPEFPSASETFSSAHSAEVRVSELEARNQYLFRRNVTLVARVAELEVSNQRLTQEVNALKKAADRLPWFLRWTRS